ncbi:MAG TPA: ATP-binding protein [Bryobacteraceae bacterium]|nr:ATP-binding protein [Bryobacteraceae bacterium]
MLHNPKDRKLFPKLTEAEVKGLMDRGEVVAVDDSQLIQQEGDKSWSMYIVLEGALRVSRRVANAEELVAFHTPGEFSGHLGLLTKQRSPFYLQSCGRTRLLKLNEQAVRKLISESSPFSEMLLKVLAYRSRQVDSHLVQEEKLAALGKMAAGLAHELNNPATAARRAANLMLEAVTETPVRMAKADPNFTPDEREKLIGLAKEITTAGCSGCCCPDPLELSDREDALLTWLEELSIPRADEIAPVLADAGVTAEQLKSWTLVAGKNLVKGIYWLETVIRLTALARDIESSTNRIAELVAALKEYSYMDQARFQEVDVHQGLENTLKIMQHKLKKGVAVKREYGADIPKICAYPGELNQVWTNLIDNAIDAMDGQGLLTIRTRSGADSVIVEIIDTGKGIPENIQNRIFEPFFTTKPQGSGTGLGLDITYRVVVYRHGGHIRLRSAPGETAFEIELPVQPPKEADILAALEEAELEAKGEAVFKP